MGKRGKKKARSTGPSGNKDKKVPTVSPKNVSSKSKCKAITKTGKKDGGKKVVPVKDRRECLHFEKGINLQALQAKFRSSLSHKCEDCRDDRGNHCNRNGGGEDKSIWVCLSCGHFSCGGVESPSTPRSHALRHSRQGNHHQLAVQLENPQLLWCFTCRTLVNSKKSKDISCKIGKIIEEGSSEKPDLVVVEETQVVVSDATQQTCPADNSVGGRNYAVRGMENVGNTCFLNSVMQCLLALDQFRRHFLSLDASPGSFTSALKKFVVGICEDPDSKSAIFNPKEFFESVCSEAPQFEGNQQQDSQELLLCLRNCLSADHELNAKKKIESGQKVEKEPSFVEAIFGGQICNTITCVRCGHSGMRYAPFSDLSLPIPNANKSHSKKDQPVTGGTSKSLRNDPKLNGDSSAPPSSGDHYITLDVEYTELDLTDKSMLDEQAAIWDSIERSGQRNGVFTDIVASTLMDDDIGESDLTSEDNEKGVNTDPAENPITKTLDAIIFPYGFLDTTESYSGALKSNVTDDVNKFSKPKPDDAKIFNANEAVETVNEPEPCGKIFDANEAVKTVSEPEPDGKIFNANGVVKTVSEPEPDVVDTDVSVEYCLSDFFKTEVLSEVDCEACTRKLLEEEDKNKSQNPLSESLLNRNENDNPNVTQGGDRVDANGKSEASDDKTVKVKRDKTEKPVIKKAPCVLTIHLKRFLTIAQGHTSKLDGHVKFSHTLDLKPYIDQSCAEKDECKYRLVGVVEHIGQSLRYGHYVAYIRAKGMKKSTESNVDDENDYVWYKANDDRVSECSLQDVLCSKAYILFYERV